jgi:tetratricopeptide (TPR) repeat protein
LELKQGDVQAARADLEQGSQIDPDNPYIWSALAEVYLRTQDRARAASAAARAEKTGADNPIVDHLLALYYSHAEVFGQAADWEARYAQSPKSDAGAALRTAQWYLAGGEPAKALPFANTVIQSDPGSGFELAQGLLRQQQFREAADLLLTGLKAHPDDARLILALGVARYSERRFDEAIANFLKAIRLDVQMEQPYLFLGRMLDQAGPHLDEITRDAEAWAEKNPDNAQAQLLLAKVLLARSSNDGRAEALLRRSIQLDNGNWEAHYQLGVVLESAHQFDAAAEQLRMAIQLDNTNPMPHYHLARVYDRLGDSKAAASEREIHRKLSGVQ